MRPGAGQGGDRLEHGDVALFCHGHISRVLAVRWVGLPVADGGMILMNPAAVTVLGTYHGRPCIEHANVVPFRPAGQAGNRTCPNPAAGSGARA